MSKDKNVSVVFVLRQLVPHFSFPISNVVTYGL